MKKYQNNFYLFIIHVLIQKEHNRQQADDWLWDTIPNRYNQKGSHPQMSLRYASYKGPFMDLSRHLGVGTYVLIGQSKHMASLRTEKSPAFISGLMVQ